MRERGDLAVLHEPFMYHHYLTTKDRLFPGFVPEPGHPTTYADIRRMILETAEEGPVFFKDMAYYVAEALPDDADFAGQMTHAFLIRNPAEAAMSYAKRDPEFTCTELGIKAQNRLYHALIAQGHRPLVMTADQLRDDPRRTLRRYWRHAGLGFAAHAFEWDDRVPEAWQSVQSWHQDVLQSGSIRRPDRGDAASQPVSLEAPYSDYVACHTPYYAELRNIAHIQAHQK